MYIIKKIIRLVKYFLLKRRNIFISRGAIVSETLFENIGYNKVESGSSLIKCNVGCGTYIRNDCLFKNARIGRFCSIAPGVKVIYGSHPSNSYVALHPVFYKRRMIAGLEFGHESGYDEYKLTINGFYCEIGSDVWIGTDAKIMSGISIGDGCIVAAGAIVTKDIPPYAIVGGVPAKIIGYRFPKEQIDFLIKFQWWNRDIEWIEKNISHFDNINEFMSFFKSEPMND